MQLPIQVDESNDQGLQIQIFEQIRSLIADGRLSPGMRMPATRALAADLGVSRNTVVGAYQRLTAEGFLEMREPIGTFVADRVRPDGPSRAHPHATLDEGAMSSVLRSQRLQFRSKAHLVVNPYEHAVALDFWVGRPDARLFPLRLWQSLLARMLREGTHQLCEYGDPQGLLALREAIAHHVGATRGIAADASQILITNGIQEGLNVLSRLLIGPGVDVVVENPCYRGASHVFMDHGAMLHGVPTDRDGIDPAYLPDSAALAYVTPSHQYPLGATLSLERRKKLLEWGAACGAYLVEDDYDSDFFYDATPLPALKSLDVHDQVVYLGTFSKSLGAALRLGYMVLPRELCQPAREAKGLLNNCQPWLEQAALATFISEGSYAHHLRRLRRIYASRRDHLIAALAQHLPEWRVEGAASGMHLVARLPANGPSAETVERMARAYDVGVYSVLHGNAQAFDADASDSLNNALLFGYAARNEAEIDDAVFRLRQMVASHAGAPAGWQADSMPGLLTTGMPDHASAQSWLQRSDFATPASGHGILSD
jgi:GntR family transcriptional regulator/MocR family aminotransferase